MKLTTTGIEAPKDFPIEDYEHIHHMVTIKRDSHLAEWNEYGIAWNAFSYRYSFLITYYEDLVNSINEFGGSPPNDVRAEQEQLLLNFFTTGFSLLETFGYGIYAICSQINANKFPLSKESKKDISLFLLRDKLKSIYPKQLITYQINDLINSPEFIEWGEIRNILMHRGNPGRTSYIGGEKNGKSEWINGMELNEETLSIKLKWLTSALNKLMSNARSLIEFVQLVN